MMTIQSLFCQVREKKQDGPIEIQGGDLSGFAHNQLFLLLIVYLADDIPWCFSSQVTETEGPVNSIQLYGVV